MWNTESIMHGKQRPRGLLKNRRTLAARSIVCLILIGMMGLLSVISWNFSAYGSEKTFLLIEEKKSNTGKYTLLIYKFHIAGLGYTRIYWAVLPCGHVGREREDLSAYELPEGYMGIGWSENDELVIEEWRPYYFMGRNTVLKTGDMFKGVRIRLHEKRNKRR
jgi:hypothetical protein